MSDEHGGEIAILYGAVTRDADAPPMIDNQPYMKKYDAALKRYVAQMSTSSEQVSAAFNTALRFTIDGPRGW